MTLYSNAAWGQGGHVMACDAPGCFREFIMPTGTQAEIIAEARRAGWLVLDVPLAGAQWHCCPAHRDSASPAPQAGDTQFREEEGGMK